MEITSVVGKIEAVTFPYEAPMEAFISSEAQGPITIEIPYEGRNKKAHRKILHDLIAQGAIKTVILTGGPASLDLPNDATLISAFMDAAGMDEFRINRYDVTRMQGSIESFIDHSTEEYIFRRVGK